MRPSSQGLATAVAVLAFAACGPEAGEESAPPDWYAERERPPSCGSFTIEGFDEPAEQFTEMAECLLDSMAAGDPAELEVTELTDEGDPVTTVYRVLLDGRLELLIDRSEDEFSSHDYARAHCTELELGATGRLLPEGCEEIDRA